MNAEAASPLLGRKPEPLLGLRLSTMMFLQWGMFGMWAPLAGRYLTAAVAKGGMGFTDDQVGWILGASGSIGAICAPFIAGQIADRLFSTERLLAVLLVVGTAVWWAMTRQTTFGAWLALSILSGVIFAPTGALTNSLAFAHMTDPTRQFPRVRVWGTIGWIVPAWVFPMVWLQHGLSVTWKPPFLVGTEYADVTSRLADSLKAGGVVALAFALYCLSLPHTPPKRDAREKLAFWKAFKLFRRKSLAVLLAASLLVAAIHNIHFIQTSKFLSYRGMRDADILPAMSVGQIFEIPMIAVLGFLLRRLGFRTVLAIGGAGYLLRFAFLGTLSLPMWAVVTSLALHGVCFACFYAAAFIYVDRLAEADVRHSAQTVFGILLGAGPVLGGRLNGALARAFSSPAGDLNYACFWYTVAAIGAAAMLVLAILFRDETAKAPASPS